MTSARAMAVGRLRKHFPGVPMLRSPPPQPLGSRRHHSPTRLVDPVERWGILIDPIWCTGSCRRWRDRSNCLDAGPPPWRGCDCVLPQPIRNRTVRRVAAKTRPGCGTLSRGHGRVGPRACAACIQGRAPRCGVCDGGVWDGHRPVQCALCDSRLFARVHRAVPAGNRTGWTRRLEAECVLLYSAGDVVRWKEFIDREALSLVTKPMLRVATTI